MPGFLRFSMDGTEAFLASKRRLRTHNVPFMFPSDCFVSFNSKVPVLADQIVITEKTSQAKDVRAAVGSRYGDILPAEGHLFDLLEPEDVVPAWKRWSPILLRPEGLYGTRPAEGGNKAAKLKAIREALRTAKKVWLATDCDREGQLIGQEILEHYAYRGQVMRVLFTAQDSQTIRDAFGRAKPNAEYARLYAAAVARRQADQIYNLSLTRTATVILALQLLFCFEVRALGGGLVSSTPE
jgi:DNA topoisomerase-3